ncbi:hypothetical protein BKA69DRAFT_285202 [Paraphysoderma sedebokerense]|nr:hypothetical protein BKA69DRAFT_285202 [Paraphysoderma sedebokerense]
MPSPISLALIGLTSIQITLTLATPQSNPPAAPAHMALTDGVAFNFVHRSSGDCWRPLSDAQVPNDGTGVGLYDYCFHKDQNFQFLPNGAIRHVNSQKCIHPETSPVQTKGTRLVLRNDCGNSNTFKLTSTGLQHVQSGMCVQAKDGEADAPTGTNLVVWDYCASESRMMWDRLVVTA